MENFDNTQGLDLTDEDKLDMFSQNLLIVILII